MAAKGSVFSRRQGVSFRPSLTGDRLFPLKQTIRHPFRFADFAPRTHRGPSTQHWVERTEVSWRSRRWWPDKSSLASGQVFEPDRPHKSLHVRGRRPKTKTLVTGP
jgi:hypothetical protein